jgi:FdhD protein
MIERAISSPSASVVDAVHLGSSGENRIRISVAEEVPVAFQFNGFPHAVMLATPENLEDFAYGFTMTEGFILDRDGIRNLCFQHHEGGIVAQITLTGNSLHRFLARRRIRQSRGNTSCGLCGVEDLADVRLPSRRVDKGRALQKEAMQAAVNALRGLQPLSRNTRGAHAAAWVSPAGHIVTAREDVGRHNALDKLIGAGLRGAFDATDGFCLLTSRCSYEMAHKAIVAGFRALVCVSAPTAFAIRTAAEGGLSLYSLSREEGQFLYTPHAMQQESACVIQS